MNKSSVWILVLTVLALVLYAAVALLQIPLWAEIAAPVFDLLAAALVFQAVFSSKNKTFRISFLLSGIAILMWGIADILWLVFDTLLHIDPESSRLIALFYSGTNIFMLAAVLHYTINSLRKWDSVQLILDGVTFSIAILWLLWSVLYHKDLNQIERLLDYSAINSLTIVIDVFLIIVIGIWYLSLRKGSLPVFLWIIVVSLTLFSYADLFYYHLYAHGIYVPDSYLDICYLASLFGIAFAVRLYYIQYPQTFANASQNTNVGQRHRSLILIFFPLMIAILETISVADIVLYVVLIMFHEYASGYIQNAISNRLLLGQEQLVNQELEQLVSLQTQSLQSTNEELQKRNDELQYINGHDSLTGLYNRRYFFTQLETMIRQSSDNDQIALFLWNIDRLKSINDTYGYATGDQILAWHAGQVAVLFPGKGVLARLDGDEFAYAVKGDFLPNDLLHFAGRIIDACEMPFTVGEYVFNIMVSVGVSLYPHCAKDAVNLMKNADIAMNHAKNNPSFHHIARYLDIDEAVKRKYLIAGQLKTARFDRVFSLNFQPQFRIADRKLVGMEALLRWQCADLGCISPAEFIPVAEEENLIIPIGNWVIEHAVHQIADWNQLYGTDLRIGINISPKQLNQASTLELLRDTMIRYQVKHRWIDIEITENVALDNEDSAEKIKRYFHNNGISVSIDDFGTGYSSLGYLSILSFDRLKIAKPLIDKITFDESSRKIVTSIILLAKSLGLQTISEGVETREQYDLLLELGCDQLQGFYLGMPMTAADFEAVFFKPANGVEPQGA